MAQDPPRDVFTAVAPIKRPVILDGEAVRMPAVIKAKERVDQKIHLGPHNREESYIGLLHRESPSTVMHRDNTPALLCVLKILQRLVTREK
jgi:hypothetical protein